MGLLTPTKYITSGEHRRKHVHTAFVRNFNKFASVATKQKLSEHAKTRPFAQYQRPITMILRIYHFLNRHH